MNEYILNDSDFFHFKNLIYRTCGIYLNDAKKELVRARLTKRLREGQFHSFREYYQFLIREDSRDEMVQFINAISTNLTRFFREPVHFDFLTKNVYPKLFDRENKNEHIRLWSAGCSTGEEPYTLAMTILKHLKSPANLDYDIKILGTDISTRVLQKAMAGIYPESIIETVPESARNLFFKKIKCEEGTSYHISEQIAQMTTFRRFNLTEPFPFTNRFNVIFCRNVMIYFDRSTQQSLIDKFFDSLKPGGYFFIGHSESLTAVTHQFKYVVPTIYQK